MLRVEKVSFLLLLLLFLSSAATSVSAGNDEQLEQRRAGVVEGFLTGLIDRALEPGTPPAQKSKLLKTALGHAETYSMVKGNGALYQKVQRRILALTSTPISGYEDIIAKIEFMQSFESFAFFETGAEHQAELDRLLAQRAALEKREFRETALHGNRFSMSVSRGRVIELIEAFIDKAIEPGTPLAEGEWLLEAASDLSKTYGQKADDKFFHPRMQHLISTLPPASISGDKDIIKEFKKALDHDNRLVMEFLLKKVEPRIEPFVMGIISRGHQPGITAAEKDILLKTANNFANAFGNMTGNHAFQQRIQRKTFTARLTGPVQSVPFKGVHVIDAPKWGQTVKNIFRPDNIVIRVGETVRWVNHDEITHTIGTLDFLSDGRFFAPNVSPQGTFERTFFIPGEYYYICFIHNSMIGKITVMGR